MLVIVSDLHLTDQPDSSDDMLDAFKIFRERLSDLAYDASWREDGQYVPIEQLHVLLLGDILDVIRSQKWFDHPGSHIRPWSDRDVAGPDFAGRVSEITQAILAENVESVGILKRLADEGTTIPKPQDGKPAPKSYTDDLRQPVSVDIHYMVGNHDWFYHLQGEDYDPIRQEIVNQMGLANSPTEPFAHRPEESQRISTVLCDHQVHAQHGDIYDEFNYDADARRDASSLGDVIVVELINRFPKAVKEAPAGSQLSQACIDGLKEIDNVRPLTLVPLWIVGLLERTCPNRELRRQVKSVWNGMVNDFIKIQFVKDHGTWWWPFDPVDKLKAALRLSQAFTIRGLGKAAKRFSDEKSYYPHAAREKAFKEIEDIEASHARYVVYGHTHAPEIVSHDLIPMEQLYLNSGTWRRVHQLARREPNDLEFITTNVMTYLAFFKNDERRGQRFEAWTGTLGGRD